MVLMPHWLKRRDPDTELDEEFATHLSLETTRQLERGVTADEARDAAQRTFGNRLRYRDEVRELRRMIWLERLQLDSVTPYARSAAARPLPARLLSRLRSGWAGRRRCSCCSRTSRPRSSHKLKSPIGSS